MLPVTSSTVRLFLHVLAATVWIGGQIALGTIVPVIRRAGPETVRAVARRFQLVAWPAFATLLVTGVWNLFAVHAADRSARWLTTLLVKLVCVALSGLAAAGHVLIAAPRVRAASTDDARRRGAVLSGALESASLLFAVAAAFLGVLLG